MWNAEKLDRTAKALLPHMSARVFVQLEQGRNSYGLDHGEALLVLFGCYFTADFMRQFYSGNMREFRAAWDELQQKVKLHQESDNWHIRPS